MAKKIVPVSGQVVGEFVAISITPMGLLIISTGAAIESVMPPSMAEIAAGALVQRGRSVRQPTSPNSRAGRN